MMRGLIADAQGYGRGMNHFKHKERSKHVKENNMKLDFTWIIIKRVSEIKRAASVKTTAN